MLLAGAAGSSRVPTATSFILSQKSKNGLGENDDPLAVACRWLLDVLRSRSTTEGGLTDVYRAEAVAWRNEQMFGLSAGVS